MNQSVYQKILDNISGDRLDPAFSLPAESDYDLSFAPGAKDGIYIFHMDHSGLNAFAAKQMINAIKAASFGDWQEADQLFSEFTWQNPAVSFVDQMQQYIKSHADQLDPGNLYHTAKNLILQSSHIECVKIGMELAEIFTDVDDGLKTVIRRLGLHEEFTLYAIWNMLGWENGNEEIFFLAKRVNGWGKVHAVERLEPATQEIRDWLFYEGCRDDISCIYSPLICWRKSDAESRLYGDPDIEEYRALGRMISGLMDESAAPGISELDDPQSVLMRFLELAETMDLNADDYEVILNIRNAVSDDRDVYAACTRLLSSDACSAALRQKLDEGIGFFLAEELGIPFKDRLSACLHSDPAGYLEYAGLLLNDPEYSAETVRIMRDIYYADTAGTDEGDFSQRDLILSILQETPLAGKDMILDALASPSKRIRLNALAALDNWTENTGQPLGSLAPDLYEAVETMKEKEQDQACLALSSSLLDENTLLSA